MKPHSFIFQKIFLLVIILYSINAEAQTFSNTTQSAYNTWNSNNGFGVFTKSIIVNALPTPLGTGPGQVVLRQINLQLGTAGGTKCDLSTYNFQIKNPTGDSLTFISTGFTSVTDNKWINIKFRDDASLERIKDYCATLQSQFYPFSIGYYRVETAGSFQTKFNGKNSNGNWTFSIKENSSNEISFEKVELVFGPPIVVNNVSAFNTNNNCAGAVCFDGSAAIIGTNNGYSGNDPFYPGNVVNGCDWNGGNNNSAWFSFTPSATTANITLSGLYTPDDNTNDIQPIIVQAPANCGIPTIVPAGGCANDTSKNNKSYQTNYGGGVTPGNAYNNGITANTEFNLSGLTVGQKYYLYIDGRQSASSTFYIEAAAGVSPCPIPLPVDWLHFTANCMGNQNQLKWQLASETNNDYFLIERSTDGSDYDIIGKITGAGTSNSATTYLFTDYQVSPDPEIIYYYRIKQVDYNGAYTYSTIASCGFKNLKELTVFPNPFEDVLYFSSPYKNGLRFSCFDVTGREIQSDIVNGKNSIDYSTLSSGTYLLKIFNPSSEELKSFVIHKK